MALPSLVMVGSSQKEVARFAGVAAGTVGQWIRDGILPAKEPWSNLQVAHAAGMRPGGESRRKVRSACGTVSKYRSGCPCDDCKVAHNADNRKRRRTYDWAVAGPVLIDAIAAGTRYGEAATAAGVSPQAITRERKANPEFAATLDAALMVGRDPNLKHGTHGAWRAGCRCPECRDVREASR